MSIEDLFPLKAEITQDIINTAKILSSSYCIGAKTLRKALIEKGIEDFSVSWGAIKGHPFIEGECISLTTEEGLDLMEVTEPQIITFILYKY